MKKKFEPYQISHLTITSISAMSLPSGRALCYFWWNDIPLGHLWFSGDTQLLLPEFRKNILELIRPSMQHYLASSHTDATACWEQYFLNGQNDDLDAFLSAAIMPSLLSSGSALNIPISVVICTRNRSAHLDQCINSLLKSTDKNFELLVVDNAPDDGSTKEVAAKYPSVRYMNEPRKGLDIARNTGARSATHGIIAYTDDDVVIEENWVMKIKACFNDPMTMAVTGQVFPLALRARAQYIFERYWGFNKGYLPVVFSHRYFMTHLSEGVPAWNVGAGANMAFRKEVFDIVGLFDERLDVGAAGCSGDSEFWYRILASGWNCFYCPQLYVYHSHRDTEKALHSQLFNYMRGHIAALLVQHEQYGHKGNLYRLYKLLPKYYLRSLPGWLRGHEHAGTLITEIRGCISGWRFYQSVKKCKRQDVPVHSQLLHTPAITDHALVSVIITCYNYGNYLQQAIDSIRCQTYQNIEIIVVDDGSADNTQAVAAQYRDIKVVYVHRVGLSAARNIGVQYSSGNFLVFLDADDYLYPNAVELNLYYFSYHPLSAFVSGGHDKVDIKGSILSPAEQQQHLGNNYLSLLEGNYIGMEGTVMYRKELFFSFHFDTNLSSCEDYDLNLRISRLFPCFGHTHKIAAYRMHDRNMSANNSMMYNTVSEIMRKLYATAKSDEEKTAIEKGLKNWADYYNQK